MKMFTRIWQLMFVTILMTSVAFAQQQKKITISSNISEPSSQEQTYMIENNGQTTTLKMDEILQLTALGLTEEELLSGEYDEKLDQMLADYQMLSSANNGNVSTDLVSAFAFSQSSGTYTEITGGTLVASSIPGSATTYLDDVNFSGQTIPFTFNFDGTGYTTFNINTNGNITFGATLPSTTNYSAISSTTAYDGAIAPFSRDLDGRFVLQATVTTGSDVLTAIPSTQFAGVVVGEEITGTGIPAGTTITAFDQGAGTITMSQVATSSATGTTIIVYSATIRTETLSTTPNRVHVIQYKNFKRYGSGTYFGEIVNLQIRLYETTNKIEVVYGNTITYYATSTTAQVGIRGATNADFNNRTTTTDWSATTAGASNSASCTFLNTVYPASGLTFAWQAPANPPPGIPSNPNPANGAGNVPISGNLTWDFGLGTEFYDLFFGPTGSMVKVVDYQAAGASGSYAYGPLSYAAGYQWQVIAHNEYGSTNGPVWSFTTACATFVAPFEEHFQNTIIPTCWAISGPQNWLFTTTWPGYLAAGITDHTAAGGSFAGVDGSGSAGLTGITLTTPFIDVSALTLPQLRFYLFNAQGSAGAGDWQTLRVDFWDGAAWNNSIYFWDATMNSPTPPPFVWTEVIVILNGYTITGDVQFRFVVDKGPTSPFYDDMIIDDVYVEEAPACPAPTGLGIANLTPTSADMVWTSYSGLSNVQFGLDGFTLDVDPLATFTGVTSPQATPTLTPGTAYDFYVQDDCGTKAVSTWAGPYSFNSPPANDDCVNAELVTGPYPQTVLGTTLGATIDCPGVLDWNAVWYEVTLPYANNYVSVDFCGTTTNVSTTGIVYYPDCSNCLGYVIANAYQFYQCPSNPGITVPYMEFWNIPGPTTIFYPVYLLPQMNFSVTFNVQDRPVISAAPLTGYAATLVENASASSHLMVGNTGGWPLTYTANIIYGGGASPSVYPQSANYWTGSCNSSAFTDVSAVRGYSTEDGWFMFDISGIPDGATIQSVEFNGYVNATSWPYWAMTPVTSDPLTTPAATLYTDINAEAGAGYYLYREESSSYTTGWKQHVLGGNVNADLQAALTQDWFAMGMVSTDNSTTYYINWDGWNQANPPYLVVTYTIGATGWMSLNGGQSYSNTIPGGGPVNDIAVAFNATGIPVGNYPAIVNIASNDPVTPNVAIPVTFNVVAGPGYQVSGNLTYPRVTPPNTALDNVTVNLMQGNIMHGSVATDINGVYLFNGTGVANGAYTYTASTAKSFANAVNVGDALLLRNSLSPGGPVLTTMQLFASDVVTPVGVNIADVFAVRQYLSPGGPDSWTGPKWIFSNPAINVSGANATVDFNGVVQGDTQLNHTVPGGK